MKKPKQIPTRPGLTAEQIDQAKYVGSSEHKIKRWWDGLPDGYEPPGGKAARPRKQNTTICHKTTEAERKIATEWVKTALRQKQFSYKDADKDFPKHIWYYESKASQYWFGFVINSTAGTYKGWPISEEEKREIFG